MRYQKPFAACFSLVALWPLAASGPEAYRIQPGDTVEVKYRVTPEFDATIAVQPDGSAALPLVGRMELAGRTAEQAAAEIRIKASERLREPEVAVLLRDYTKPSYTVTGEVGKPGTFDLRGEVTLMRALANAGWFKESSRHSQVILVRRVDRDWGEAKVFNLSKDIRKKQFSEDPVIRAGDLVVVPQNTLSKLDRYFRWAAFTNLGFLLR